MRSHTPNLAMNHAQTAPADTAPTNEDTIKTPPSSTTYTLTAPSHNTTDSKSIHPPISPPLATRSGINNQNTTATNPWTTNPALGPRAAELVNTVLTENEAEIAKREEKERKDVIESVIPRRESVVGAVTRRVSKGKGKGKGRNGEGDRGLRIGRRWVVGRVWNWVRRVWGERRMRQEGRGRVEEVGEGVS
ncbi:hypothetical protein T440DRAFT_540093 [Plenodomus tracheiphilus IPT5]|uniref:Uncharacterized protein n=1 Tax=Plenodomus tracheiphilus IPT5 TaxID=1408161 RepID=A0A6A7AYQ6_9PLEO|nr:hypothetical protein T440DRAFT_540093 [Plenodomus tracheiphilus IPT5]